MPGETGGVRVAPATEHGPAIHIQVGGPGTGSVGSSGEIPPLPKPGARFPKIGPNSPQKNNWIPIAKPNSVCVQPRSTSKSKKKRPNVCLIPNEIITNKHADINVIRVILFGISLS